MVGALQYDETDISFVVSLVSQFMHQARLPHLHMIKQIFWYLVGNCVLGSFVREAISC